MGWCHFVGVVLQQAAVVLRHFREDGEIEIVHVRHLRRLRLPTPAFRVAIIIDKVVVGRVDVLTSVIPLEDWKIAVELTAIAHQLENFWKDVVAEETQERELRCVRCPFVGAGDIAVNKISVAHFPDGYYIVFSASILSLPALFRRSLCTAVRRARAL
jgi:hypothetical protein